MEQQEVFIKHKFDIIKKNPFSGKQRILVLDDHQDILEIIEYVLDYENYEVVCVDNIPDFYKRLNKENPDLILLDYILKDGNGGDICKGLKADTTTSNIPVILLSAYFSKDTDFSHVPCDGFITKPFDLEFLLYKVKESLAEK